MIIGVNGYGFTGSGAVTDLLKEFQGPQVLDTIEFKISYMQDGLEDLSYHLNNHPVRFYSSDMAIRRFRNLTRYVNKTYGPLTGGQFLPLVEVFLDSITQAQWHGMSSSHRIVTPQPQRWLRYTLAENMRKLLYKSAKVFLPLSDTGMYLSISPENYLEAARTFIKDVLTAMGLVGECIVLNQAFPADRPEFSFPYFEQPKAISVSRDPRDMYILAKTVARHKARFIPSDDVEVFIIYYRKIMENTSSGDDTLRISFEDLVYRYEETVSVIQSFTCCGSHERKRENFKAEVSRVNTNLSGRHPSLSRDIARIEEALPEWLYPFERYGGQDVPVRGKVF